MLDLNEILYHACPASKDRNSSTYIIDTHCLRYIIVARHLGEGRFHIIAFKTEAI